MDFRTSSRRTVAIIVSLGAVCAGLAVLNTKGLSQAEVSQVPLSATSKLTTLLAELTRVIPQQPALVALAPGTAEHAFVVAALPKPVRDALHGRMMRADSEGNLQVYIEVSELTKAELQELESAGVRVEVIAKKLGIVQARVPGPLLAAVADLPFVRFIRLPNYAIINTGSVDTQGDTILKADQVRSQLHVDGTNVRVGVISDGIKGIFATTGCTSDCGPTTASPSPINTGDLPNATGTRNSSGVLISASGGITAQSFKSANDLEGIVPGCAFAGAGAEGTALMEIVYDLAPKVTFFFSNADTDVEFNQAVDYIAAHSDVGVDDLSFVGLPYDGTSDVSSNTSAQLNSSTNPLRAYFTSVGNFATFHYLGKYVDSVVNGSTISGVVNPGDLHLFQACGPSTSCTGPTTSDELSLGPQPYDLIRLPAGPPSSPASGGEVVIVLTWDDPYTDSTNNYDLYLEDASTGAVVDKSTDPQSGPGNNPVEFMDYINNTGAQRDFHILVQNVNNQAAAKNLSLYVFQPECAASGPLNLFPTNPPYVDHNYNTVGSSVAAESDAGGGVVSVGAENQANFNSTTNPLATPIEFYSSNGPTLDGRMKPDVTAVDGVAITGAGNFENPFFGTSAAAPHGAGVAALLLQAASCFRAGSTGAISASTARNELRSLIVSNADPIGSPVPNNTYGSGLIDALAAAVKTVPTASAGSNMAVSGNVAGGASVTLNGSASSDPDGCPLMFNWSGSCGTATGSSPAVTCPPGNDTESLTVSNNGVTLSPASTVNITVSDFTLAASPSSATVSAGQSATYMVSVSTQYGAFTNPISFSCGTPLPTGASCSFSPATVTPGSGTATSQLTLSTTGASAAFAPLPRLPGSWPGLEGWLCLAALLGFAIPLAARNCSRRRRLWASLAALVIIAAIEVACGGGSSSPPPPPKPSPTPAGTYSIAISGKSGTLTHSANATLVVQ